MSKSLFTLSRNERKIIKFIRNTINSLEFIIKGSITLLIESFDILINLLNSYEGYKKTGYTNATLLRMVDTLSPRKFEIFIAELFKSEGYTVKLTPKSNDYGRDVILKKDGITTFVECKHYSKDNKVGREICQKLLGSMFQFKADNGIIVTTGKFNKNAYEVEQMVDNLQLLGRDDIIRMILKLKSEQISRIIFKLTNM